MSSNHYWDVLVHYRPSLTGRKSLIDDPKFFLSPRGKTDPDAELAATLAGLFQTFEQEDSHPRCRFVARYEWLKEQLNIDESKLPAMSCTRYQEAMARMQPRSAALVFPSAHVNSPTTMFGHTLIRIDSSYESNLLSYAVSYAAVITDTNGIIYGFKGVFGFYPGYFSVLPYYEKVKEYNHMEHRDMWEYELNLTEPEVRQMTNHVWELDGIASDYYFFDENCAYMLLFLLDAARPSLRLTDKVGTGLRFWVIPSDTIRAVRESGLIKQVQYRPSASKRILTMAARMDDASRDASLELVRGKVLPQQVLDSPFPAEDKIKVLDLSAELLQYQASRQLIQKDAYLKSYLAVLNVRSTLGRPDDDWAAVPRPVEPEQGHRSSRLGLGYGYDSQERATYVNLGWRAAYQGLMDPDDGFVEGSEIKFGDVIARYYPERDRLRLWQLHALDIFSLAPRDEFFKSYSWKVNTGLDRLLFRDDEERLVYRLNFGRGLAYRTSPSLAYMMGEVELNASNVFEDRYALGFGISAGILKHITESWKAHLFVRGIVSPLGDCYRTVRGGLDQNIKINKSNSITLSASHEHTWGNKLTIVNIDWNYYY